MIKRLFNQLLEDSLDLARSPRRHSGPVGPCPHEAKCVHQSEPESVVEPQPGGILLPSRIVSNGG